MKIKEPFSKIAGVMKLRHLKTPVLVVASILVLVLVFFAGALAGFEKARFSYGWGENYFNNFAGRHGRFIGMNAHGVVGEIISLDNNTIILKGQDDVERTILTDKRTDIRKFAQDIGISGLKSGDKIIVLGKPDDGQIKARFIRVIPANFPLPPTQPDFRGGVQLNSQGTSTPATDDQGTSSPAGGPGQNQS